MGTLTLYPDGLCNLDGDATRELAVACFTLLAPDAARARWEVLPPVEGVPGAVRLVGRADRTQHRRFRAPQMARALFAALPPLQKALRLLLYPRPGCGWVLVARP